MTGGARAWLARLLPHASVRRRLVTGALTIGALGAVVKVVALAKELVVAAEHGRSDELDAFLMALVLPATIGAIVGGAFHQAVVPRIAAVREREGEEGAAAFFGACLGWGLVAASAAALAVAAVAGPFLEHAASGFPPAKLAASIAMARALAPLTILAAWATMLSAALHGRERYAAVAAAPALTPLAIVAAILVAGTSGWALAAGALAGAVLELALVAAASRRAGYRLLPRRPTRVIPPHVRETAWQALPALGAAGLHAFTGVVEQVMASRLEAGSVAALGYASRLASAPLGLASLALGSASFAVLSTVHAQSDAATFRRIVRQLVGRVAAASAAAAVALALAARVLVEVLYERGRFDRDDTELVAALVRLFALVIPFFVTGLVGVKILAVLGRNRRMLPIAAANLVLSVVANVVAVRALGIRGVPIAAATVYAFSCVQIGWALRRALRDMER